MRCEQHQVLMKLCYSVRHTARVFWLSTIILIVCVGCAVPLGTPPHLSGHLHVVGSTALQPLVAMAAKFFTKQNPQVQVDVQGGGSITGLRSVTAKQSDIGDSDIYADPAIYPDPDLTDHIVCLIPFTMIVNSDVKNVTSLTNQQLIDIYSTRTIRNWKDVGGPDLPIVPIVRPNTSGTRATFRKYILGGGDENGALLRTDSSLAVRDTVAHTPGAIGYLALSVLDTTVRAVSINSFPATAQNIVAGNYAFWGYEHMDTLGDDNPLLSAFLTFMLTPAVQQEAQREGYIPIASMKLPAISSSTGASILSTTYSRVYRESEVEYRATI